MVDTKINGKATPMLFVVGVKNSKEPHQKTIQNQKNGPTKHLYLSVQIQEDVQIHHIEMRGFGDHLKTAKTNLWKLELLTGMNVEVVNLIFKMVPWLLSSN